jgi:hypothetical protein
MSNEMLFQINDVKAIAEALIESAVIHESSDSYNYWGNICRVCNSGYFHNNPVIHEPNCAVLIAKDILTNL